MPYKDPATKKAYNQRYYADHQEELVEYSRAYYDAHQEEILAKNKANQPERTVYMHGYRRSKVILPRMTKENTCGHPDREHYARNMCVICWRLATRDREKNKRQSKERRTKLKEELGPEGYTAYLRERSLRLSYKLTVEDFEKMVEQQGGLCCCGKPLVVENGKTPCVDHDHACCPTNKTCGKCLRGILCMRCNMVLGLLEDNHNLLPKFLSDYLKRYECKSVGLTSKLAA